MENNESLSKKEFAYIRQQEKSEALIEVLETKLANEKSLIAELFKKVETLTVEKERLLKSESAKRIETPITENEKLKAEHEETKTEFQLHIQNIELEKDELKKENEELKAKIIHEEKTKEDETIIYHKCSIISKLLHREDKSNWMEVKVLSTDSEKIKSLIADGYVKKEIGLHILKKKWIHGALTPTRP